MFSKDYDVPAIERHVDFINLVAYDMHGSWERQADHHAPLFRRPWDQNNRNIDYSVNYWIAKGMPAWKINLGIPLYGRSWILASDDVSDVPAPASGAGAPGPFTKEAGFLAYFEICRMIKANEDDWTVRSEVKKLNGPIAFSSSTKMWVGYDDAATVRTKSQYALSKGLGGVMAWDVSMDDFSGACGQGVNPLLTTIAVTFLRNNATLQARPSTTHRPASASNRFITLERTTTTKPLSSLKKHPRNHLYSSFNVFH